MGKIDLVALLCLPSCCLWNVVWPLLAVLRLSAVCDCGISICFLLCEVIFPQCVCKQIIAILIFCIFVNYIAVVGPFLSVYNLQMWSS